MRRIRPLIIVLSLAVFPSLVEAQIRRQPQRRSSYEPSHDRQMSLVVGALDTDFSGEDSNFPMAALRSDWRLNRFLRLEVGVAYALGEVETTDPAVRDPDMTTHLVAGTVGLLAELPLPFGRPYVGVATGLFGRFDSTDDDEGGEQFVRPTNAFPVGVRLPLTERLWLRGEVRFRFDQFKTGASATNVEQTVGLSFSY
jgi:hypothetical protein